ncbi:MAG: AI-2E family transporter [Acutalibacter sp.]
MFSIKRWKGLLPLLLFTLGYSLAFVLWVKTFLYTLPFLLGFLIALAVQPVIAFLERKLHLKHIPASLLATGGAVVLLFAALALVGILAVREIAAFLTRASQNGFEEFAQPVAELLTKAKEFLAQLDLEFLQIHQEEILDTMRGSMELLTTCLSTALNLLTSLPTLITLVIVAVCAAYFFARDLDKILAWGKGLLPERAAGHVKSAMRNSTGTWRNYLLSYLFLYFLTFCQTCVILAVLGLPYPLIIGLLTAVADVLPILGPGMVLAPVAIYQLLAGHWAKALGVAVGWLVISSLRQVIEPKLVASTVKIHPLASLAAVYFSLAGQNLWILFYVLGLCTLYSAFRETGALPSLTAATHQESEKPS